MESASQRGKNTEDGLELQEVRLKTEEKERSGNRREELEQFNKQTTQAKQKLDEQSKQTLKT